MFGAAVVAVEIDAVERGHRLAAVHVAADDRAVAVVVGRLDDRITRAGGTRASVERVEALALAPAPVDSLLRRAARSRSPRTRPARRRRSTVSPVVRSNEKRHGLRRPHIQISGARRRGSRTDCRPGRCRPRRPTRCGIDAQDLAERRREVLAVAVRVAGGAAVAEADVEHAVGPELEIAAVVVRVRLLHEEHAAARARDRRSRRCIAYSSTFVSPLRSV